METGGSSPPTILGNLPRHAGDAQPRLPLTSLEEKLIKIGAKVVSHGRYVAFRRAEVAIADYPDRREQRS